MNVRIKILRDFLQLMIATREDKAIVNNMLDRLEGELASSEVKDENSNSYLAGGEPRGLKSVPQRNAMPCDAVVAHTCAGMGIDTFEVTVIRRTGRSTEECMAIIQKAFALSSSYGDGDVIANTPCEPDVLDAVEERIKQAHSLDTLQQATLMLLDRVRELNVK